MLVLETLNIESVVAEVYLDERIPIWLTKRNFLKQHSVDIQRWIYLNNGLDVVLELGFFLKLKVELLAVVAVELDVAAFVYYAVKCKQKHRLYTCSILAQDLLAQTVLHDNRVG